MSVREKLLAKSSRVYKTITDPDGDKWTVRSWTEREKSDHELSFIDKKSGSAALGKLPVARLKAIASSVVDPETKELVFSGDDWQLLAEVRGSVTSAIYAAILSINGFDSDDVEEMLGE